MFLESSIGHNNKTGWVEVICGSMFSGKTEELIRRLKRAKIAGKKTEVFKPNVDNRYDDNDVVSHDKNIIDSTPVSSSASLLFYASDCDVVGIDEAQFFDDGIIDIVTELANSGKRVVIAGLDMDFKGRPFGPMPHLMAIAEHVTKVHAICMRSGELANYSHRKSASDELVELGELNEYEALSRAEFWKALKEESKT